MRPFPRFPTHASRFASLLMPPASNTIARFNTLVRRDRWAWLYAPTGQAVEFALRNTIAALLALGTAMWMELDSPIWATMTVWAVAQGTRGESLSKARWRIVGTIMGATAAVGLFTVFPQQPALFFLVLALWMGVCAGFATFVSNFRAYALVLAGYTCAIIAMGAVYDPDNVFMIAVSRSTYIALGVICEAGMGLIFATSQERQARQAVRTKLQTALSLVSLSIADILSDAASTQRKARELFATILRLNSEIEFAEIEMGPHGHEGDHARAALAAVSILLSRGFGMATRLAALSHSHGSFRETSHHAQEFLRSLEGRLKSGEPVHSILADLHILIEGCRIHAAPFLRSSQDNVPALGPIDERVLHVALGELLNDLEVAIIEYDASTHLIPRDRFHFRLQSHRDPRNAINNGLRVMAAILFTALVWEVTAWPNGTGFISMTALICGLFATQENPVLGTTAFLKGAIWSVIAGGILTFIFVPKFDTYEMFIMAFGPAMFIGGLARANAATAGAAAAYGLLMPSMVNVQNHHRLNEIAFFNGSMATVMAACAAVLVFHTFLPFNPQSERLRLRRQMLSELRSLCHLRKAPETRAWIGRNIDRFARLIRHAGPSPLPVVESYLQGTLAVMTIGLNVIRLRTLLDREHLPVTARRPIELLLDRMEYTRDRHDRPARVAAAAVRRLRELDRTEQDLVTRLELIRGISYLVVIRDELVANAAFLDETHGCTSHQLLREPR
ncbi:FUSC family protein [Asaia lannensis]|uniref:FUSC family protein n=1 Tax=Asaia lannensis NBRC 102526 TaxID=1307926 RepID=A0ABT1CGH1_9PROT|nr:FUSC family protein [Asaia lannensis]MCO6159646.1 FUSC family protein [Asaia lannensis NBRC 102526]